MVGAQVILRLLPFHVSAAIGVAEESHSAVMRRLSASMNGAVRPSVQGLAAENAIDVSTLPERIRREARRLALPLIAISVDPNWAMVQDAVEEAIAPALLDAPRLTAIQLAEQRRLENAAAARQIRLWQRAVGLTELAPFLFACECGRRGCTATCSATPDEYDARASLGFVRAAEHAGS